MNKWNDQAKPTSWRSKKQPSAQILAGKKSHLCKNSTKEEREIIVNTLLILQSHTKVAACDTELYYKRARQMFSNVPRGVIRKKNHIYIQQNRLCGFGVSLPSHPHKNFESKKYKRKKITRFVRQGRKTIYTELDTFWCVLHRERKHFINRGKEIVITQSCRRIHSGYEQNALTKNWGCGFTVTWSIKHWSCHLRSEITS